MSKKKWLRSLIGAVIGMGVAFLVLFVTTPGWFIVIPPIIEDFENKTYDLRFSYQYELKDQKERDRVIEDIIIVDIDERSLEKLGRFQQWPRAYQARIIDYLSQSGALSIGFDVLFFEEDKIPEQNDSLVAATAKADRVFHALSFEKADLDNFRPKMETDPIAAITPQFALDLPPTVQKHLLTEDRLMGPFEALSKVSRGLGFANAHPDPDGVNRQWPLLKNILSRTYPSLALSMAMHFFGVSPGQLEVKPSQYIKIGDKRVIPIHKATKGNQRADGWMLIKYYGDMKTFRYISFYDVLQKRVPPQFFRDKLVLVGASATGLMDLRSTPIQGEYPGVEIHATVLYNLLTGDFITRMTGWTTFFIVTFLGIIAGTIALRLKPYWGFLLTAVLMGGYLFIIYHFFTKENVWLEAVRPIVTILFTFMGIMVYRYLTEEREKKFIRGAFQHYLAPSIINQLTENPNMLKLGGEKKVLTAFFSDVAGFSTFSEKLTPEELVMLLNEYLTEMCDIILKYEGTVDKFEGDAVIAFFGAPISYDDHARRACLVSLEMQQVMMPKLRQKWSGETHWPDIVPHMRMRIGLNTGAMVVGNMGSRTRMDYTMMGDSVNLAARLESANKQYGTYTMISEYTYNAAQDQIEARLLDKIRVVGKSESVKVYELLARKGGLAEDDNKLYTLYTEGIRLYQDQQWDQAIKSFDAALQIKEDEPAKRYIERCQVFKKMPPPAGWDGVYTLTSK